jgi:predicted DNA-binding protein
MVTVRLPEEMEKALNRYAKMHDRSKSQVIKEALACYLEREDVSTPYTLGADLFGRYGSGEKDGSTTYKSRIKKMIDAKHRTR